MISAMSESAPYTVASEGENTAGSEDNCSTAFLPGIAIGIDIGTAQCGVAVWNGSHVEILRNTRNQKAMRSYTVFKENAPPGGLAADFHRDPELLAGAAVFNVKRLIGRVDTDPVLQASKALLPFLVQTLGIGVRPSVAALVNRAWRSTTPEEVLAVFLIELRAMAEIHLKHSVQNIVITVPASFSRFQISRVERACAMAGLRVLRLMPEPTAAALLYAQHHQQRRTVDDKSKDSERIALIFSMGAGFADAAVAVTAGGISQIRTLSGIAVGGEDLLQNTIRRLVPGVDTLFRCRNASEVRAVGTLRVVVQDAIHRLSVFPTAQIDIDLGNGMKIARVLERQEFEEINRDVFDQCRGLIAGCLRDAKLRPEELNDVIVVGGCSYIPKVRELVLSICKKDELYGELDALEAPILGAALEGAVASGISDPFGSLDLLTIQVTPLGLGIRADGNAFVPIIPRNTTTPARKDVSFSTAHENQEEALVLVYEGDGRTVEENHLLGYFKFAGIPPAPAGVPEINVTMDIDALNVLRVYVGFMFPRGAARGPEPPFMEVRMPTVEDGHGWCTEALNRAFGSSLDLVTVQNDI